MGVTRSTHVFYGTYVPSDQYDPMHPWEEGERITNEINRSGLMSVGHLIAGPYDDDGIYLVAGAVHRVTPGKPWQADGTPVEPYDVQAVYGLAARLGYSGIGPVRLTVVVDVS